MELSFSTSFGNLAGDRTLLVQEDGGGADQPKAQHPRRRRHVRHLMTSHFISAWMDGCNDGWMDVGFPTPTGCGPNLFIDMHPLIYDYVGADGVRMLCG